MRSSEISRSRDGVLGYLDDQLHGEEIAHLERVEVEHVGGIRYEIWDAHTRSGERWWVVTNPTNLYTQQDFKSRDVVLTFHIGLAMRLANRHEVPITPSAAEILIGPWRRWEQAVEALENAEEAEQFQAVGNHLREALISFAHDVADDRLVPTGMQRPKASAVVEWLDLLANYFAPGEHNARLRSYLKGIIQPTWNTCSTYSTAKTRREWTRRLVLQPFLISSPRSRRVSCDRRGKLSAAASASRPPW